MTHGTVVEDDPCYPDLAAIPGGCPLMFGKTSDFGHRCMRWVMRASGRLAA